MEQKAFTLAEVLITLMIIGVVAAITIPSVIGKYRERALVTKLIKVNTALQEAYNLANFENEDITNGTPKDGNQQQRSEKLAALFVRYLNNSKLCNTEIDKGCFSDVRYKTLQGVYKADSANNDGFIDKDKNIAKVLLLDGTSVYFKASAWGSKGNCKDDPRYLNGVQYNICGWIGVDVNGPKPPNQYGVDYFEFTIGEQPLGVIATGGDKYADSNKKDEMTECCNLAKNSQLNGRFCTAWVLEKRNMDYLRCKGLTWTNKNCLK